MNKSILQKILAFPFWSRQRALAKIRPPLSESDFVDLIDHSGGDRGAAAMIYSKLQDWVCHEGFTPYPNDSLGSVFGIAEEELDEDLILDVFVRLGLSMPPAREVTAFGAVDTATGIAQLVALARPTESTSGK